MVSKAPVGQRNPGDLADGESYDSDEESDASCNARPHGLRDRYEKHCSESRHGEQQVEKTRHQHHPHCV